jgi:hypothetical protein
VSYPGKRIQTRPHVLGLCIPAYAGMTLRTGLRVAVYRFFVRDA